MKKILFQPPRYLAAITAIALISLLGGCAQNETPASGGKNVHGNMRTLSHPSPRPREQAAASRDEERVLSHPSPRPIYTINTNPAPETKNVVARASQTPDLTLNLLPAGTDPNEDNAQDEYVVDEKTKEAPPQTPRITINLPPENGVNSRNSNQLTPPRPVIITMGPNRRYQHQGKRRAIHIHIPYGYPRDGKPVPLKAQ
ncbi:MAG: hypothetical protein JO295_11330 [Verrucomicrobia bacterium]|nr:hypothetical protein [Verrucomicrobiota bacterium]